MNSYIQYRPESLKDAVLRPQLRSQFMSMLQSDTTQSMLFYGRPGTGKSCVAKLFSTNTLTFRCDGQMKPNEVVNTAWRAASSRNLFDDAHLVILLDELDRLHKDAQEKVRALIDDTGDRVTFIGTTNHIGEILPALKSRMTPISFDVERGNLTIKSLWRKRLDDIFHMENGAGAPQDRLDYALRFFPDGRQMVANLVTPLAT
jgi:putative ATPase